MNTIKVPYEIISKIDFMPFSHFIFDDFKLQIENWIEGLLLDVQFFNDAIDWDFVPGHKCPILMYSVSEKKQIIGGLYIYSVYSMDFSEGQIEEYIHGEFKDVAEYSDAVKKMIFAINSNLLYSLSYIMNYPRDQKQTRVSSHKYSREYRLSTKQNRIYLFSDILKYVSDTYVPEGQHHSIQCPCWEVRGHYRHYKSGKVIFIPAYKKGKQRDKAEPKPKEYYV